MLCYFGNLMKRCAGLLAGLMLAAGCASEPDHELADWHIVLTRKRALLRADATHLEAARQSYVDALESFRRRYPNHVRAREVYSDMELAYARELFARGDYAQAARFFQSVLQDDPENAALRRELDEAVRRRFVNREALDSLKKGMTFDQVERRIGQPPAGWQKSLQKGDRTIISWFYRRADGGTVGVYFMDGRLFAADYDGAVRLRTSQP